MNKLMIGAMCLASAGYIYAQEAAPAPEATSQEQCAIEEKDVDTMMDEYIASKGWVEGRNEKAGKRFFVAKGTGVIQAPRASQQYIDSRVNAYNKAMLEAKKAMVEYLGAEIATETEKEYAEGSAANPPPPTEGQEVAGKLKQFLYAKLNKALASEGIDPVQDPAAAKKALGKQLNSEKYKKLISTMAQAKVLGFQAACTFEGSPSSGKGEIGVVAIWSEKLQQMASSIVTGAPVPPVGGKKPISAQVSADPKVLMSTFGVQQKIDESGDLVLVGFGQAGAISESKTSANAAKTKAKQAAMAAIREFAGEQVAVATATLNAESSEEFESGAEVYSNESAMKEKIKAAAGRMNIAGIAPLRNVKCKHPLNGKTVFVCAVTWAPKQANQARALKSSMAKPMAPGAGANARPAAPAAKVPSGPLSNQGQGADEDAF
ncbi:MAG: DUF6844 domain-containing protein [Kiritimatiellia bacterium]